MCACVVCVLRYKMDTFLKEKRGKGKEKDAMGKKKVWRVIDGYVGKCKRREREEKKKKMEEKRGGRREKNKIIYILKIIDSREEIKKKAGKAKEKCICLSGIPGVFLVY